MENRHNARWKLWHQDNFDLACPRQIEAEGEGLLDGLIELWTRHLLETVIDSGTEGFNHFDLWWEPEGVSIRIVGTWNGQVRIRGWVLKKSIQPLRNSYKDFVDFGLITRIATVHETLILKGETSQSILDLATTSANRAAFERRLQIGINGLSR